MLRHAAPECTAPLLTRNRRRAGGFLAALMLATACGGASTAPSPIGTGTSGRATNTLSAVVDGTPFTAAAPTALVRASVLSISGTDTGLIGSNTLSFTVPASVGTHRIAPGTGVTASYQVTGAASTSGWTAGDSAGSGSVTLDTLTSTRATGSYELLLAPMSGAAAGPRSISSGRFDVALTP